MSVHSFNPSDNDKERIMKSVSLELRDKRNLNISAIWLSECLDHLSRSGPWSLEIPLLSGYVYHLFLSSDIRLSQQHPVLPGDIQNLHRKYLFQKEAVILQIDEIMNITTSRQHQKNQLENQQKAGNKSIEITAPASGNEQENQPESIGNVGRTNKLLLSDGFQNVVAIDVGDFLYQKMKNSVTNFVGTKIAVKNVFVRRGAMLLTGSCAVVLGGEVRSLIKSALSTAPVSAANNTEVLAVSESSAPISKENMIASSRSNEIAVPHQYGNISNANSNIIYSTTNSFTNPNEFNQLDSFPSTSTTNVNFNSSYSKPTSLAPNLQQSHRASASSSSEISFTSRSAVRPEIATEILRSSEPRSFYSDVSKRLSTDSAADLSLILPFSNESTNYQLNALVAPIPTPTIDKSSATTSSYLSSGFKESEANANSSSPMLLSAQPSPVHHYEEVGEGFDPYEFQFDHYAQENYIAYDDSMEITASNNEKPFEAINHYNASEESTRDELRPPPLPSNRSIKVDEVDDGYDGVKTANEEVTIDADDDVLGDQLLMPAWRRLSPSLPVGNQPFSENQRRFIVRGLARKLYRFRPRLQQHVAPKFEVVIEFDDGCMSTTALIHSDLCLKWLQENCHDLLGKLLYPTASTSNGSSSGSSSEVLPSLMQSMKLFHGIFVYRVIETKEEQEAMWGAKIVLLEQRNDSSSIRRICHDLMRE